MDTLFNTNFQSTNDNKMYNGYGDSNKRGLSLQPESLFSLAMYDIDAVAPQPEPTPIANHAPAFHPVDEYKDLSLKELLDLSDDYLFGETPSNSNSGSSNNMLNPIPLNVPHGESVASHAQASTHVNVNVFPEQSVSLAPIQHVSAGPMPPMPQMVSFENTNNDVVAFNNVVPMPAMSTEVPVNNNKRSREVSDDDITDDGANNNEGRFRPYQAGQWAERFNDLCKYRERMGNCLVPHTYKENLPLARWVKRQRYQYKLMMEGKSSTMTEERVRALEDIGFVWDSQGAAWGERLDELKEFRKIYLHCNVPSNFSENPQLATWVKCQRRQYKLHMEGKPSNMTAQRIQELESIGFEWLLRSYKKARTA